MVERAIKKYWNSSRTAVLHWMRWSHLQATFSNDDDHCYRRAVLNRALQGTGERIEGRGQLKRKPSTHQGDGEEVLTYQLQISRG